MMRVRWYITLPILIVTEIRCNAQPPANGRISATSVSYGGHTAYSCDDGYYLTDKAGNAFLISIVTCLETGEFSNVLSCEGLLSLLKFERKMFASDFTEFENNKCLTCKRSHLIHRVSSDCDSSNMLILAVCIYVILSDISFKCMFL